MFSVARVLQCSLEIDCVPLAYSAHWTFENMDPLQGKCLESSITQTSKGKFPRLGSTGSNLAALDADWERKQRNREYRIAARREKRNRKADEKKQRKLNATILRRMVCFLQSLTTGSEVTDVCRPGILKNTTRMPKGIAFVISNVSGGEFGRKLCSRFSDLLQYMILPDEFST